MQKKTALIADPQDDTRQVAADVLTAAGFDVTCVRDGLAAWEMLRDRRVDVAVLELVMPAISGERICRLLASSPLHADTRIIVLSAVAREARTRIGRLGVHASLAKTPADQLAPLLRRALATPGRIEPPEVQSRTAVVDLLAAQRRFEVIIDSMQEAVVELAPSGVITFVNPAARKLLKRDEGAIVGQAFSHAFGTRNVVGIQHHLQRLVQRRQSGTLHMLIEHAGREYRVVLTAVYSDENLEGLTAVLHDVTDQALLEQERRDRDRLAGVIEMAGAAAHELNQPLAVISGQTELLLRTPANMDIPLRRRLQIIFKQVQRLGRLTQQFSNIVAYKTRDYGNNITLVDIERSAEADPLNGGGTHES